MDQNLDDGSRWGCEANGDVSGWGVIVSLLTTSSLSVVLSLWCAWVVCQRKRSRKLKRAHRIISAFLMDLSVNQIVTGIALYACVMKIYGPSYDPHAILAIRLSNLSTVSQLPIVLVANHASRSAIHIRFFSSVSYGFAAAVWGIIGCGQITPPDWPGIHFYTALICVVGIVLAAELFYIFACLLGRSHWQHKRKNWFADVADRMDKGTTTCLDPYGRPSVRLFLMAVFMVINVYLFVEIIRLKWFKPGGCDLSTEEDDKTTFGQVLSIVMLGTLIYAFLNAFVDVRYEDSEEPHGYGRVGCQSSLDVIEYLPPQGDLLSKPPLTFATSFGSNASSTRYGG
ncbi:hypothetical protein AMS68_000198 [Peltaster fructicola]|uniref:Uncharacterized protein n=1 Tax=Peltaster fructicola TaxID=286661 RepID=A0A6H0XJ68_9PEZI|nr:hypothetical protein AMS68_000198 [Peltaster fructicola]